MAFSWLPSGNPKAAMSRDTVNVSQNNDSNPVALDSLVPRSIINVVAHAPTQASTGTWKKNARQQRITIESLRRAANPSSLSVSASADGVVVSSICTVAVVPSFMSANSFT